MCEAEGLAKPLIILDIDPLWGAWPTVKGSEGSDDSAHMKSDL